MSNLGPQQQNLSYDGLLQVDGGISSTLKPVQDGLGNFAGLWLSSTGTNALTATDFVASVNGTPITGALPRPISDGFGDYVSVKDFGAVGDGVTDDTVAIQNAVNSTAGRIFVPQGIYRVTSAIQFTGTSGSLFGAGKQFNIGPFAIILIDHSGTGINIIDSFHIGTVLSGIAIRRSDNFAGQGTNINYNHVSQTTLDNVWIDGGLNGIYFVDAIHCAFSNFTITSSVYPINFGTGNNILSFSDFSIYNVPSPGVALYSVGGTGSTYKFSNGGIEDGNKTISFDSTSNLKNIVFENVWFEGNTNPADLYAGDQIYFKNCRLVDQQFISRSTFGATNVFIDGLYGYYQPLIPRDISCANITPYQLNVSDFSTSSDANQFVLPSVSAGEAIGNSVISAVSQTGAILPNNLSSYDINGDSAWLKIFTNFSSETDPFGGTSAYSWTGSVYGAFYTPLTISDGSVMEYVVWVKGKGRLSLITRTDNLGLFSYYDIDTTSWRRIVFKFKKTSGSTAPNRMGIQLTPDAAGSLIVWRPGVFEGTSSVDSRPYYASGSFLGGWPSSSPTFGGIDVNAFTFYGTTAPASGAYNVGDKVINTSPTSGGYLGWVCTTAGTPGTWKTFGVIS